MEFREFNKIFRLHRDVVVTEKIDGTNASIFIGENGEFLTGSRNRWVTPDNDNFGFSKWANANKEELLALGVGHHFGEWYGSKIQRGYDKKEKSFALFNTNKWKDSRPAICEVVPVLYEGMFSEERIVDCLSKLRNQGSIIAPGFMKPEGIVIFHKAANICFKKTLEKDEVPKSLAEAQL